MKLKKEGRKMKIFILAYMRNNIGDDLFVETLTNRYKNVDFYINIPGGKYSEQLERISNLTIFDKPDTDVELIKMDIELYDGYVYIGGSIFMEGGKVYNLSEDFYTFVKRCNEKERPLYYISSNFGPYKTEEYLELAKKTFASTKDICFRDTYSKNLFPNIKSVRYAPDALFTYEGRCNKKIKDSVGISIIDLNIRPDIKENKEAYLKTLKQSIEHFIKEGKSIYLFSFCEHEGDENAINELIDMCDKEISEKINIVRYEGILEAFLTLYEKMESMICARFHSLILSVIYNQKYVVMSYSKKISRVIEDLELTDRYLDIKDMNQALTLTSKDFDYKTKKETEKIIEDAKKQFEKLDIFLQK